MAHPIIARFRRVVVAAGKSDRGAPRIRFWLILVWQTLTGRDIRPLSREMHDDYVTEGLEYLPQEGVFALAVNHTMRRWTPHVLASIHHATLEKRPDLARDWLVIVGYREAKLEGRSEWVKWIVRQIRKGHTWVYRRWSYNALRLTMANDRSSSVQALREWKTRARRQPSIVFPEGHGYPTFGEVRPGAGRWLANLGVPTLPASIWWEEEVARWRIVFGPPIEWSAEPHLHDLQVGLEIAYGLPSAQAPDWQAALIDWQQAHEEVHKEVIEKVIEEVVETQEAGELVEARS